MSSTLEVGKKLVDLCKQGKFKDAIEQLYAPNIVSVEGATALSGWCRTVGRHRRGQGQGRLVGEKPRCP